ncbi:PspC domain-containing protein [Algimonas porphyrae]|uniref:Phage-shock protein n=1 Tax=Algimonas porphyrae TaxID=1128113 RepID=A0ABQ5V295_9PROT|nr:PspC domain-containing protein [Algimonas porphyrae]GLQ21583.1 phage-shock protein [Algimonas porphyrae]
MTRRYEKTERWEDEDGAWEQHERSDYNARPKLRRNKIDGILGGVCAGLGDWLGIDHGPMRIFFVLAVIFTGLPVLVYFLMWIFIPSDKRAPYVREKRERHRAERKARRSGQTAVIGGEAIDSTSYSDVRSKFRSLEERLQDLERSVTSREWKLRRDFRDLES